MMVVFAHIRDSFAEAFFPRWAEWVSAGTLAFCGFILRANDTLMAGATTDAYKVLLAIATQSSWSVVLILFAMARIVVLFVNGAWRRSPHLRATMAFLACYWWTTVAMSMSTVFGLAFAFACGFLVLDIGNAYRAARDARTVDDRIRMTGNGKP